MLKETLAKFSAQMPAILAAAAAAFFLALLQGIAQAHGLSCTPQANAADAGVLGAILKAGHSALAMARSSGKV